MTFSRKIVLLLSILSLSACSTMSKNECMTKDWQQAGYHDGSQGKFQNKLASESKACAKYNIAVDHSAYAQGWESGVRQFCVPSRAMQLGVEGKKYNPVCPQDLAGAFEKNWRQGLRTFCQPAKGYALGRSGQALPDFCAPDQVVAFNEQYHKGYSRYQQIAAIRSELNGIQSNIDNKNREISRTQAKIDDWMHKLQDPVVLADPVAVESLRVKVKENNRHIRTAQENISYLQIQRATVQAKLSRAEAQG